jgi:hypothetical protein
LPHLLIAGVRYEVPAWRSFSLAALIIVFARWPTCQNEFAVDFDFGWATGLLIGNSEFLPL